MVDTEMLFCDRMLFGKYQLGMVLAPFCLFCLVSVVYGLNQELDWMVDCIYFHQSVDLNKQEDLI